VNIKSAPHGPIRFGAYISDEHLTSGFTYRRHHINFYALYDCGTDNEIIEGQVTWRPSPSLRHREGQENPL